MWLTGFPSNTNLYSQKSFIAVSHEQGYICPLESDIAMSELIPSLLGECEVKVAETKYGNWQLIF